MASKSRPSSWIPSHSGWDRTLVSSGHIWLVVIVPIITALGGIVLSELRGAGVASDLVGSVRRALSCKSGHVWLGLTSPRPFRGRDGGEVVCPQGIVRLRQEEGVTTDPVLSVLDRFVWLS